MTKETSLKRNEKAKATQNSIVMAAEKLFIENGFSATAISEIAKAAGVTKSLIHHHFGSKEALWDAVEAKHLAFVDEYLEKLLIECRASGGSHFYSKAIKDFFKFADKNQGLLRMQSWICAEQRGKRTQPTEKLLEVLQDMKKDQEEGIIRKDMPTKMIMVILWSLVEQWFIARSLYSHRLKMDFESDEAQQEYIDSIIKLFHNGLFMENSENTEK